MRPSKSQMQHNATIHQSYCIFLFSVVAIVVVFAVVLVFSVLAWKCGCCGGAGASSQGLVRHSTTGCHSSSRWLSRLLYPPTRKVKGWGPRKGKKGEKNRKENCTEGIYVCASLVQVGYKSGTSLVHVWYKSGTSLVHVLYKSGTSLVEVWWKSGTSLVQVWYKSSARLVQVWYKFGTSMVQLGYKFGTRLVQDWYKSGESLVQV